MKEQLIEKIVELEWQQFQKVQNEGGRASCQDNRPTFNIMRTSQFLVWEMEILESYYQDLQDAEAKGWNLLTEKYARMMKSTAPVQYVQLKERLPERSERRLEQQERMLKKVVSWEEAFAKQYPGIAGTGRVLHTYEDTPYSTSMETYARGELSTYSDRTVELLEKLYDELERRGDNLSTLVTEQMVKLYGYQSLEDAENRCFY